MTTKYCYQCGKHHPEAEMRQIVTKGGTRWRCITSIQAAKKAVAERDAFGKKVSEANSEAWLSKLRVIGSKPPIP
jgi:hypothetical protein